MLPKVATHILHHTSRAAAAVQTQTSHTIRNVLQSNSTGNLGPWNGPGSSSSNWGSNGPGPGGSKYNAGSRFHNGYTGAGRAVTQANAITSQDGLSGQTDDTDELPTRRVSLRQHTKRPRIRSHSLSITGQGRNERGETLGVLSSVKIHARSRHVFAQPASNDSLIVADIVPAIADIPSTHPALVRRNSTSIPTPSDSFDAPPLPSPFTSATPLSHTDPAAPQTTAPPERPARGRSQERQPVTDSNDKGVYNALREARDNGDADQAAEAVRQFRQTATSPSVAEFNMAIEALHETRRPGEPLNSILETYNDMLKHSLLPNLKTYLLLVLALTDRDHEIHKMIQSLESRSKKRVLVGRMESHQQVNDQRRIEELRAENNFSSAMSLFEAIIAIDGNDKAPWSIYNNLLRSCAYHSSIDSAIHVFAQLEQRSDIQPSAAAYMHMISVYSNAGEFQGAQDVFQEFLTASKEGRVRWTGISSQPKLNEKERLRAYRITQIQLWNKMIEASFKCGHPEEAINIVERMMDSKAGPSFVSADVPPPASSTYTAVVAGFCQMGDLDTALRWFEHLLQQKESSRNPYESSASPLRPDILAWMIIIDALALEGKVDELNKLFRIFCETASQDRLEIRGIDRLTVYTANLHFINKTDDDAKAREMLEFVAEYVLNERLHQGQHRAMVEEVMELSIDKGAVDMPVAILQQFVGSRLNSLDRVVHKGTLTPETETNARTSLRSTVLNVADRVYRQHKQDLPFATAIQLARVGDSVQLLPTREHAPYLLHAYGLARQASPELSFRDWELLAYAASEADLPQEGSSDLPAVVDYAFAGTVTLLEDMARRDVDLEQMQKFIVRRIAKVIFSDGGADDLKSVFGRLGPRYEQVLANANREPDGVSESPTSPSVSLENGVMPMEQDLSQIKLDTYATQFVDEMLQVQDGRKPNPIAAFGRFEEGIQNGRSPNPVVLGRLIQALGRISEVDKVRHVYTVAQNVLVSMEYNKKWQSQSWFTIEDSMIIALAHAGDVDSAHVHRARILEQGGAPTADAYGALILYVKDTTDDTSNAMALFQESQMQGIQPNLYLYNNIISKLAKARKADYVLELFQEMKANRIRPSSITYGAVIGACARVGDVHSAEILFEEMVQQPNFKPRIPPYNTMMQLYTTTKPNRERALFYFQALNRAGVRPTAHTYKLLIDAYGSIEPIDVHAMERVFKDLENDRNVEIQGAHWAALINAWGCVKKDLDKAIGIFDSIAIHPKTARSQTPLPDAVVYEAMVNVLVAHRRTDLIPAYMERLNASGVHMTAYITNFLIKGYAIIGDLEQARQIFESLVDPPEGMAAPNNHTPHEPGLSPVVSPTEPVYREPSTWEVMVRAELGNGNRDRAVALLERLQARQYPEAVYNRISGIMLDHSSVSPWPTSPSFSNPSP